jgi:hypothetical protein
MECRNHVGVSALDRCTACAEPFCHNCLVEIHGQRYCGACKVVTLKRKTAPLDGARQTICPESKEALLFSIIGLFPFFFCIIPLIFAPLALVKANAAKARIRRDPGLDGRGMATAGQIIAVGALCYLAYRIAMSMAVFGA